MEIIRTLSVYFFEKPASPSPWVTSGPSQCPILKLYSKLIPTSLFMARLGYIGMTYDQHVVVGFPDQDYRYKSVAIEIPHDSGLAPIPYTGRKFLYHWGSNLCRPSHSTSSKQYAVKPRDNRTLRIFVCLKTTCQPMLFVLLFIHLKISVKNTVREECVFYGGKKNFSITNWSIN